MQLLQIRFFYMHTLSINEYFATSRGVCITEQILKKYQTFKQNHVCFLDVYLFHKRMNERSHHDHRDPQGEVGIEPFRLNRFVAPRLSAKFPRLVAKGANSLSDDAG